MITIRTNHHRLQFKQPFKIAHGTRTHTDSVFVEIRDDGLTGTGEASLPPYRKETIQSIEAFCSSLKFKQAITPESLEDALQQVASHQPEQTAARAALSMALYDLAAQRAGLPLYAFLGNKPPDHFTSWTLTMNSEEALRNTLEQEFQAERIKVKLTGEGDEKMIRLIREYTQATGWVDVNAGWKDKGYALEIAHMLKDFGFIFLEQPFDTTMLRETEWLSERSPIPVYADESCQTIEDLPTVKCCFSGINVKLMKCGGIREAANLIGTARQNKLGVMLGGMAESSCAATAAAHLSGLADYVDLDGPLLINNDPYVGLQYDAAGKIRLGEEPGLGVKKK